jgi:hypothetical protein
VASGSCSEKKERAPKTLLLAKTSTMAIAPTNIPTLTITIATVEPLGFWLAL